MTVKDFDVRLPPTVQAPGEARRQVAALGADLPAVLLADLQLLVSELVSNSVRHAALGEGDFIDVWGRIGNSAVRVEVSDPGHGFMSGRRDEALPEGRSGLWLLDRMSSRWGIERDGVTRVWFEADLPEGTASPWSVAIDGWPEALQSVAAELVRHYGTPAEAGPGRLTWKQPGGAALVLEGPSTS